MLKDNAAKLLGELGIQVEHIAHLTYAVQKHPEAHPLAECRLNVEKVLSSHPVWEILILGSVLDMYARNNLLPDVLQQKVLENNSYINNLLALSISSLYGTKSTMLLGKILNHSQLTDDSIPKQTGLINQLALAIAASACTVMEEISKP